MYQSQFGLSRRPFSSTPDPNCVVPVGGMPQAISELEQCAEDGQGIGILTAPAGLGKTVLCRKLAENLRDEFAVVFLPNANFPTRRSLLQAILYEMGHPYLRLGEQELRLEFTTAVRDLPPDHAGLVIIVDEAHLLHNRLLEELRTATHLVHEGEMLVRLILSGQLELEERLVRKDLAAINQRIVCHATLASLTMAESEEYLEQRLESAGGHLADIFEADAIRMICQASDGNARCLNQLADQSLVLAGAGIVPRVNVTHVLEALDELKQLPLHWNPVQAPRDVDRSASPIASNIGDETPDEDADEPETAFIEFGPAEETPPETKPPSEEHASPAENEEADDLGHPPAFEPTADSAEEESEAGEIEISWDDDVSESCPNVCPDETATTEILSAEDLVEMGVEVETKTFGESPEPMPADSAAAFTEELVSDHYTQLEKGFSPEPVCRAVCEMDLEMALDSLRAEEEAYPHPPVENLRPEMTVVHEIPAPGEEWQPEDLDPAKRPGLTTDPSEVIEHVMPLIDAALEDQPLPDDVPPENTKTARMDGPEDSAPMVVADAGMESLLTEISAYCDGESSLDTAELDAPINRDDREESDRQAEQSQEYFLSGSAETSAGDIEYEIAQMVLDTYGDVQPLIWNSHAECETAGEPVPCDPGEEPIRDPGDATPYEDLRNSLQEAVDQIDEVAVEDPAEPEVDAVAYDIVMPESDEAESDEESSSESDAMSGTDAGQSQTGDRAAASVPRPYRNLFSKIRRKEQA